MRSLGPRSHSWIGEGPFDYHRVPRPQPAAPVLEADRAGSRAQRAWRARATLRTNPPTKTAGAAHRGRRGYDLETLLGVAVQVFNERGYDGTSMEDLSQRLGIAKSGIYHHVNGKEELLGLALDRALDGIFAVAAEVQTLPLPAFDRLEHLVRGSVQVLMDRLPYVTLLLRVRGNTVTERRALERRRQFDRLVADLVEQAEAEGDIRSDIDALVIARLLFGTVNSLVEWYRPGKTAIDRDLPYHVCSMAFDGLRVRALRAGGTHSKLDRTFGISGKGEIGNAPSQVNKAAR
jgi:AcrR family transcriptional regulator